MRNSESDLAGVLKFLRNGFVKNEFFIELLPDDSDDLSNL